MRKCFGCQWHTDKCKNDNSKNKNKFPNQIKKCIPVLIDKNIKPISTDWKRKSARYIPEMW